MRKLILLLFSALLLMAATVSIPKDAKCFMRNLMVYEHPEWASTIELKDGKILYFSSPKSMFEFYFETPRWPEFNIKEDKQMNIYITDFETLEAIPAKEAHYVYGSSKTSPAGDDLPAFARKKSAQAFMLRYGGSRVLDFYQVSHGLINLLNGRTR
ncbi:MAG: nitrous oxide reductase accessory protein NosL [Sulfurospirillum sp.]|nr:nitrous oxide reductase accessory protein NosL [Sulfurospirillum sp.]